VGLFNALTPSLSYGVFSEQSQGFITSYNYLLGKTKNATFALNLRATFFKRFVAELAHLGTYSF